jgi:hypothetical protein
MHKSAEIRLTSIIVIVRASQTVYLILIAIFYLDIVVSGYIKLSTCSILFVAILRFVTRSNLNPISGSMQKPYVMMSKNLINLLNGKF